MKFLIIIAALIFASCGSYIQIADTGTTNCKTDNNTHIFENDSIKITYGFWANHGNMAFTIYNKTDKPLYINWRNSSFIVNGVKHDYWSDIATTKTAALTLSYAISGRSVSNPRYNAVSGTSVISAESITTKPEKITFIPPKSTSKKISFYLVTQDQFKLSNNRRKFEEPLSDCPKRKAKIEAETFSKDNSPIKWRNYLAISGVEEATNFVFIDNEFYLSSIREMSMRHFKGKSTVSKNGESIYPRREKNKKSFYLNVNSDAKSFFKIK